MSDRLRAPHCSIAILTAAAAGGAARRKRDLAEIGWRLLAPGTHPEVPLAGGLDEEALLLLEWPTRALLVQASRLIPIPGPPAVRRRLATEEARALLREQRQRQLRHQRLDAMIAFVDALNQALRRHEVLSVLRDHVLNIVEAWQVVVLEPDPDRRGWRQALRSDLLPEDHVLTATSRFERLGVVGPVEMAQVPELADLAARTGARMLMHAPLAGDAVLLLLERRADRIPDYEEWELLRTLSAQTAASLERVRLFEEVQTLSLTDPLTGLANRRQMDVVFDRVLPAAARGEPLSVVMIDLDHFKRVNDTLGHQAGDRLLVRVAGAMREVVRGSDLVVRFGGDEFVLILPGSTGAGALVQRLRDRLGDDVEFSAGIAEWTPDIASAEALLAAADDALLRERARTRGGDGTSPPPSPRSAPDA